MINKITEELKILLPEADEAVLSITVKTVVQNILNYTARDVLPEELLYTAVMISKAYYENSGLDGKKATVTSVKRGDVQTNFGEAKTAASLDDDGGFFGYREMLNPFRVLKLNYSKRGEC